MRMLVPRRNPRFVQWFVLALVALAGAASVRAQVVIAPAQPVIGSGNTVSADPRVPAPDTKSCTVSLFENLEFADFNTKNFTYTPPSDCPGPWAKVVFTVDFTVTAGTSTTAPVSSIWAAPTSSLEPPRSPAQRSVPPGTWSGM